MICLKYDHWTLAIYAVSEKVDLIFSMVYCFLGYPWVLGSLLETQLFLIYMWIIVLNVCHAYLQGPLVSIELA